MNRELALVRMNELSKASKEIAEVILNDTEGLDEFFIHMVGRWMVISKRIAECSAGESFEWNEEIALKLKMMEISEEMERFKDTSVLPGSSKIRLKQEIDSIVAGMDHIEL